jgi:hypothetical protein
MITPTKLAMNHASSGTATTTFEGRTEVDVVKLLKRPNVQKIIQQIANNIPVEEFPSESQESAAHPSS